MSSRLRVLHLITRMIVGGAQENTLDTVCGLDHEAFETELVCGPQSGPEGSLIEEARRRGARLTIEPDLVREISPVRDLVALRRLTGLMRSRRVDIVHTHSSKAGIIGRLAARRAGVPWVVHTVHGWPFRDGQPAVERLVFSALERFAASRTDRLIAVTPRDVDKGAAARVASRDRFEVVRSAVDVARFSGARAARARTRRQWGFDPETEVVGTITRLSPQKAPLDFIEAAAMVAAERPQAGFVVVGDGPLRAEVDRQIRRRGIEGRFRMLGIRRDVPELMAGMDLFALTSRWEGLPRVVVQAMASGVPVVATAVDGSTEIVRDGETGWLVSPNQPHEAAGAVLQALADREARQRCIAAGRELVDPEFDLGPMLASLERIYRELAATAGPPAR